MRITKRQLKRIIRESLIMEIPLDYQAADASVHSYTASVVAKPEDPSKWQKKLVSSGLEPGEAKDLIRYLQDAENGVYSGLSSAASLLRDVIMAPMEAKVALQSDLYQYFALDATEEQKKAALDSMKKTGPDFAWEAFFGSIGVGLGAKATTKAVSTGAKTAKKAPKTVKPVTGTAAIARRADEIIDANMGNKEFFYKYFAKNPDNLASRDMIIPTPGSPRARMFKEEFGIEIWDFHRQFAERNLTYAQLSGIPAFSYASKLKNTASAGAAMAAKHPDDYIVYRGIKSKTYDPSKAFSGSQDFTDNYSAALLYAGEDGVVVMAAIPKSRMQDTAARLRMVRGDDPTRQTVMKSSIWNLSADEAANLVKAGKMDFVDP